jgi:hypothetical protein
MLILIAGGFKGTGKRAPKVRFPPHYSTLPKGAKAYIREREG